MKIIFAGTSHGVPEKDRFCSSTFLGVGKNWYIIDAGAPISPLLRHYDIRHEDVKGVFITHLHGDHTDGLIEFCDQISWYFLDSKPAIFLPEQFGVDLIRGWIHGILRRSDDSLNLSVYDDGLVYQDDVLRLSAVSTRHIPHAHAFSIEAEGKKVFFTGDMSADYPEFPDIVGDAHYQLIVAECAHNTGGLISCIDTFKKADTERMVIQHIFPEKLKGIETLRREELPFDLEIGYDGLTLEI